MIWAGNDPPTYHRQLPLFQVPVQLVPGMRLCYGVLGFRRLPRHGASWGHRGASDTARECPPECADLMEDRAMRRLRSPEIEAPVGTHTGWNLRRAGAATGIMMIYTHTRPQAPHLENLIFGMQHRDVAKRFCLQAFDFAGW
eukprot:3376218-Rhodomonas_salina.4